MIKNYPHVETERRDAVLIIRLDNADAHNALSREMRFSLREITRELQDDRSVRAVYLTGKGKSFCAGGDLRMLTKASEPWAVHRRFRHAATLFPDLVTLDKPVVCGVRGHAMGGGLGLALMSDLVIAGESANFASGFFRLGVVPDCLTLFALPRLIGLAKARNFLYSNASWTADEAVELGVALKSVPDDQVDEEGIALATKLAQGPAEVMGLAKQLMLKSFENGVAEIMEQEGLMQVLAMSSAEFQEGLSALIEKRKPDYQGAALAEAQTDGLPASGK